VGDAKNVLKKYKVFSDEELESLNLIETPKEEKYFKNVENILALSNQTALEAMAKKAKELGVSVKIVTNELTGEVDEVSKIITDNMHNLKKNEMLLYGGETTVKVSGTGHGGRNLQLGLSCLRYLNDDEIVVTVATDGRDNGEFGGAVCDMITKKAIEDADLSLTDYIKNNDSYSLFEKVGNYLMMGDTGSNVSDLIITMKF